MAPHMYITTTSLIILYLNMRKFMKWEVENIDWQSMHTYHSYRAQTLHVTFLVSMSNIKNDDAIPGHQFREYFTWWCWFYLYSYQWLTHSHTSCTSDLPQSDMCSSWTRQHHTIRQWGGEGAGDGVRIFQQWPCHEQWAPQWH